MRATSITFLAAGLAALAYLGARLLLWARRGLLDELGSVRSEVSALARSVAQAQLQSTDVATSLFETLGDVRRHTEMVAEQAREFTALQDLLKAPMPRGGLGEALLEELLRQVLPPNAFSCQHRFASGTVVDAVVRSGGRLVCIDSKFPLSNYRRLCEARDEIARAEAQRAFAADLDRHIKDIAARYILPDEKTLDFAVMYVPAEGVYGELLETSHRGRPLLETAIAARVVPMSPLYLYGFLQTVLFGLKCSSIERSAEAILDHCGRLQREIDLFSSDYETLGRHVANARTKHEDGARRLGRLRESLDRMAGLGADPPGPAPGLEAVND
jgi:DNA recombination protein RmuC